MENKNQNNGYETFYKFATLFNMDFKQKLLICNI